MNEKSYRNAASIIFHVIIGFIIGWLLHANYIQSNKFKLHEIREYPNKYHYINPLLFIDTNKTNKPFDKLNYRISQRIESAKENGDACDVSIYFRELNTGMWTGIDENEVYEPGSMLKVLIMMSYLKKIDSDPALMDKKLNYVPSIDPGQFYKPEKNLAAGSYSVGELLEHMIKYSDNSSAMLLLGNNKDGFLDTYKTLDLPEIPESKNIDYMSPKSYSSIFRTLFNASYLSKNLSEQALILLSDTTFKKGLVSSLPTNTIVAHKFGEFSFSEQTGSVLSRELHDCGIVYYPGNPYFICIMTRGYDFSKLEKIISDISKITYDVIDRKN